MRQLPKSREAMPLMSEKPYSDLEGMELLGPALRKDVGHGYLVGMQCLMDAIAVVEGQEVATRIWNRFVTTGKDPWGYMKLAEIVRSEVDQQLWQDIAARLNVEFMEAEHRLLQHFDAPLAYEALKKSALELREALRR